MAAAEYGGRGNGVNAIAPSAARTSLYLEYVKNNPEYVSRLAGAHALRRACEPVEQARAVMWLLSDDRSFVTGARQPVDGGYTLC